MLKNPCPVAVLQLRRGKRDNLVIIFHITPLKYRISSFIRRGFFLPKQLQRSRSILLDGSISLGLFRKGKIGIIAKFHRTDLVI